MRSLLVLVLLLTSVQKDCDGTYLSEHTNTEEAVVVQMAYIPATESETSGVAITSGKGIGVGPVFASTSTEEIWAVVIRCKEHGKSFALRGKEVYDICSVGARVELTYRERYKDGKVVGYKTEHVELLPPRIEIH